MPEEHEDNVQDVAVVEQDAPTPGTLSQENKESSEVGRDSFSCNIREAASTDSSSTRVGQYASVHDSVGHHRRIPELDI